MQAVSVSLAACFRVVGVWFLWPGSFGSSADCFLSDICLSRSHRIQKRTSGISLRRSFRSLCFGESGFVGKPRVCASCRGAAQGARGASNRPVSDAVLTPMFHGAVFDETPPCSCRNRLFHLTCAFLPSDVCGALRFYSRRGSICHAVRAGEHARRKGRVSWMLRLSSRRCEGARCFGGAQDRGHLSGRLLDRTPPIAARLPLGR